MFRHDHGVDLSAAGACPGALIFEILGARPRDSVLLLVGLPGGTTTKPSPPCQSLTTWLISPRLLARVRADEYGAAVAQWNAPAGACGRKVMAVDLASCTISNPNFL